jgi:tetratricopeptide (TPR) repeat protein
MSLKDIEKLKEKVDKDPNSKLFVPLAEEYKKEGMHDEAMNVLLSGLEKQPGYTSARVSLGKIYLDKGMQAEATEEFEKVIKQIPDNLYAHKKLAEIYKDTGKTEQAINAFRAVLKLNPMDEEVVIKLKEIESGAYFDGLSEETEAVEESVHEEVAYTDEATTEDTSGISGPKAFTDEIQETPPSHDKELAAFKSSLFGSTGEAETETEPIPEVIITDKEEDNLEVLEEPVQVPEDEISFGDINEALEYAAAGAGDIHAEIKDQEIIEETEVSVKEQEPAFAGSYEKKSTIEDADKYISEGSYIQAMNIYRDILSTAPGNKKILQRIEELRALIKLLGKDKELLISKLNIFLEGIHKRRDEFLGST